MGSGDPIQLTHANQSIEDPAFFPDGKRILYARIPADETKSTIETISTLGGEPKVLIQGKNSRPKLSPDSRYLLSMARMSGATGGEGFEWFALPVDGGNPVATGAGAVLRAAGLAMGIPILMTGDRVLFLGASPGRKNVWEIRLSPGAWRVQGVAQQLTFGTQSEIPLSASGTGTLALSVGSYLEDFYLIPLSAATGQPTGVSRRLTQDGRSKSLRWYTGGDPGSAYFSVLTGTAQSIYAVDLETCKQTFVGAGLHLSDISPDGRQVAYSVPEGDSYTIRVGDAGAGLAESRVLCKACGLVNAFSPDGRFLFHDGGAKVKADPKRKLTVRLLEVASGKDRPWLEHPTDSVFVGKTLGLDSGWLWLVQSPRGSPWSMRRYLVPFREEAVQQPEWIRIPLPDGTGWAPPWRISTTGNVFYLFRGVETHGGPLRSEDGRLQRAVRSQVRAGLRGDA